MQDTMLQSPIAPAMPVEIARAIGEVMTQIKSLPKGEHNDHGGYRFTSIDAFLAFTGPLCASVGLIVLQDEDGIDLIERAGKTWVKMTYSFTLAHTSGVLWDRPIRRTVFQRVDGPQTTGGTQSYSLKMFLRSLFAIPTGDQDDPDFHQTQDMPVQARKEPQECVRVNNRPTPPKTSQAIQRPPSEPQHIYIEEGASGLRIGSWVNAAMAALEGQPEGWRRAWLELHLAEVEEVRRLKPQWADKIEAIAISPDALEVAA